MREIELKIVEEDQELFVAILALGILEGLKSKIVLHEIGVWSLARPVFLKHVSEPGRVNLRLIKVIEQFDELSLLNEFDPDGCDTHIDAMISVVKEIMLDTDSNCCRISWVS